MKHKFQVGDRVVVVCDQNTAALNIGDVGTVCWVYEDNPFNVGVESDRPSKGHSCDGHCRIGHGWWVPDVHLELIVDEAIEDEAINLDDLL